jgi:hypothetical protein
MFIRYRFPLPENERQRQPGPFIPLEIQPQLVTMGFLQGF